MHDLPATNGWAVNRMRRVGDVVPLIRRCLGRRTFELATTGGAFTSEDDFDYLSGSDDFHSSTLLDSRERERRQRLNRRAVLVAVIDFGRAG